MAGSMSEGSKPEYDIYVVGLGICTSRHITREVEEAIRKSSSVYYVAAAPSVDAYLRSLCERVIDLHSLYGENQDRLTTL